MHIRKKSLTGASTSTRTAYEARVIWQALKRAGGNINLKGHIHEILVRNRFNFNPLRLFDRQRAKLVINPTAKAVDLVIVKSGKVLSRIQLKDTPRSISKVLRKIHKGQYRSVKVLGTDETVIAFNKAVSRVAVSKAVKPSGVSSEYTSALARRAGVIGAGSITRGLGRAARFGGLWGAVICGTIALIKGLYDVSRRRRRFRAACVDVGQETAGGAVSGAAAGATATLTGAGLVGLFAAIGFSGLFATFAIVFAPLIISIIVGIAAKEGFDHLIRRKQGLD